MKPIERKPLVLGKSAPGLKPVKPVPLGMAAPRFETLLAAHPEGRSPTKGAPDLGDPEANVDAELSEVAQRIKAEKKARRDAYRVLTDNNFYLVVCFQSEAQRDAFLALAKWRAVGMYVDGLDVARRLGVDVEPVNLPIKRNRAMPVALRGHKVLGNPAVALPESDEEGGEDGWTAT